MAFKEEIILSATDQASPAIDSATKSLETMTNMISVEKIKDYSMAIFNFGQSLLTDFVTGAMEAEKASISLEAAIKRNNETQQTANTLGYDWGITQTSNTELIKQKTESYTALATQLQSVSVLEDDSIIQAMALFETNDKLKLSTEEYTKLLPDLAAQLEINTGHQYTAKEAALELARGIEGNSRSFKLLGIDLKDTEGNFVGTEQALKRISAATNGASEAVLKSDMGIRQMANAWGNFKESIGATLLPVLSLLVNDYLIPLVKWLNDLSPTTKEWIGTIILWTTATAGLVAVGASLTLMFTAFGGVIVPITTFILEASAAVAALYVGFASLFSLFEENNALVDFFESFMSYDFPSLTNEINAKLGKKRHEESKLINSPMDALDESEYNVATDNEVVLENLYG